MTTIAIDDLPRPCLIIAPDDGAVMDSNSAAQELFGKSARKLAKITLADLIPDLPDMSRRLDRMRASPVTTEYREVSLQGQSSTLTLFPLGESVALLIHPERPASSRTMKGRSVHSLGQMIGHELKNPLAGIKGAAQLLRHDVTDAESLGLLDLIGSEIDRIRRLADRLQTFGESESQAARVNIHTILRNARKLIATGETDVFFTEDYDPSLPHISGDSDALMQVVINLIKNAVEAMGEDGGDITLRTRSRSGVRRGDAHLPIEVQVIDTGPGLPRHMRDRIFEPFVTSKPSGQGLGLALVAKVVETHGGIVEVDSRAGRTAFSILLPAASLEGISHAV